MEAKARTHAKLPSKPVVSSRLPKAFSHPLKIRRAEETEKAEEYKQLAKVLSPIKLNKNKTRSIKAALQRMPNASVESILMPACLVQQNELITLAVQHSSYLTGAVRRVLHCFTLKVYIVRHVPVSSREERQALKHWLGKWCKLQGKYSDLVQVIATFWNSPEGCVSVVQELAEAGSLKRLIDSVGSVSEGVLADVLQQLLRLVRSLHNKGVVHGELSTTQVLFTRSGKVRLGPGLAARIIKRQEPSVASDVYELGYTTLLAAIGGLEWLEGALEYSGDCCLLHSLVKKGNLPYIKRFSPEFIDFLCRCLKHAPSSRATVDELIRHPWLSMKHSSLPLTLKDLLKLGNSTAPEGVSAGDMQLARICNSLQSMLGDPVIPTGSIDCAGLARELGLPVKKVQDAVLPILLSKLTNSP
jgi:serine/threonine protein kinase